MHQHILRLAASYKFDIVGVILAALAGAVFLWMITPPGHIAGTSGYWQTQVDDVAQYLSGYRAFVSASWSIPILSVPSINWPEGTILTFLDAIPSFSILLKILGQVIPLPRNPLGYWVLLCYAMQGASAWFMMRQVVDKRYYLIILGVALCIMMPALSSRMAHISLQAHFLLLFSLGLYFRGIRLRKTQTFLWTALVIATFYTNLYLAAMTVATLIAAAVDHAITVRRYWALPRYAIAPIVLAATVPFMIGHGFSSTVPDPGFGIYSMNLLSPVGSGSILSLPFYKLGTEGQYEGYNYLGLGLISTLGIFSIFNINYNNKRNIFGPFLIFMLILLFIYSLSKEIYISDLHLLKWNVPFFLENLFESFRSSGRFFWIVGYALVVAAIYPLCNFSVNMQALVAVIVLGVQIIDLTPTFTFVRNSLEREPHILADIDEWRAELAGVTTLHAFPKFKCPGGYAREVLPLQSVAAEGGYNLTTGFISRYGADCEAIASEIEASDPATSAYVFATTHFTPEQIAGYMPANAQCKTLEIWSICRIIP